MQSKWMRKWAFLCRLFPHTSKNIFRYSVNWFTLSTNMWGQYIISHDIFCDFSMKPLDRCEKSFSIEQVSTYKKNTLHSHGEQTLSPMKWQQVWQMMEYIRRWWPIFNAFVFYATKNVRFQWILEQPWHLWTLFNKEEFS